jgi:hypothetical protein
MGDLSDLQRGQIVGAHSAGAFVKTVILLGLSSAAVSKAMTAYTNHRKTSSGKEKLWMKTKTK